MLSLIENFMSTERRQQFFSESLKLMHHKGYKGTTMRDIAESMGCDVANLYNFVRSKEEILALSLFKINDEFQQGIDQIISSQYSPSGKLRLITQLYVRLTFDKPYEISLLVNGWRFLSDGKKATFLAERNTYEGKVKSVIEEGIAIGELKALDPELSTNLVLSSMRWLFDKYVDRQEDFNPVEVERQINEFVLNGIAQ